MTKQPSHPSVPDVQPNDNPFERALREGVLQVADLLPFAVNLHELVRSNVASARHMAARHATGRLGDFYRIVADGEAEALRLLTPFVDAVRKAAPDSEGAGIDPLAQAYPAYIARIAVAGCASDYLLCYLHLSPVSTKNYRELAHTLNNVSGLSDRDLAHFVFFGDTDPEVDALATALAAEVKQPDMNRGLELGEHLHYFEGLFWQRMAALCTETTGRDDAHSI